MVFRFYCLKEYKVGSGREYDKVTLDAFLMENPFITISEDKFEGRIYTYTHPTLQFSGKFVMAPKSKIPNFEAIGNNFLDVNFYLELELTLPNLAIEILLTLLEEICKQQNFFIYNEALRKVIPFKKLLCLKAYESWKKAYASRNLQEMEKFSRLDPAAMSKVYSYIQKKPKLEILLDTNKVYIPDYKFMKKANSRTAFVCITWDGMNAFVLPPNVDILFLDDGKSKTGEPRCYSMREILGKAEKLFKPIDGTGEICQLEAKGAKKLYKILNKEKFAPVQYELTEVKLSQILDL